MSDQHESKLDAAISRGFDPHQSYELTAGERARVDAARAEGRDLLADFAADVNRVKRSDPEIERLLQQELAERDREWWS